MTQINQPVSPFVENFTSIESIANAYGTGYGQTDVSADILRDLEGATIHLAWYGYGDYCGSSLVIYEKNGKLYEVNGGHCSCCGLEGQWRPEETTTEALRMRNFQGYEGAEAAQKILDEFLATQ